MAISRRSGRSRYTLILLVLTSVTVITLDFRGQGSGVIERVREEALDLLAPVQDAADQAFSPVGDVWEGVVNYGDLESENRRLRERLAEVQGARARAVETERAHRELLGQNQLAFAGDIPAVAARVIAVPISNFELAFEIDQGRGRGIKVGMPVVAAQGLVGRVVRVSDRRSVVQLITDRDFAVGVRLAGSDDVGVATGGGRNEPLTVSLIDPKTKVRRREEATTSGLPRSVFPPSIPVGRVESARVRRGELEQEVTLTPAVQPRRLTFVKVLLWEPPP